MSEDLGTVRVRLLLARWVDDEVPVVVSAIDSSIWEHWDEADERAWRAWRAEALRLWGIDESDVEWREVWATFSRAALAEAVAVPTVTALSVEADS